MLFGALAAKTGVNPQPAERVSWQGWLSLAVACGGLATFYHFLRVRPQSQHRAENEEVDLITGECADARRLRRLRELDAIDDDEEATVLRKREEHSLERAVACGAGSAEELREHRRCTRLLDRIADLDQQLARLHTLSREPGTRSPDELDRLRARRAKLCQSLERPSIWPGVLRNLLSQVFWRLPWLPVTVSVWVLFTFAWQEGNLVVIALAGACLLSPLLLLIAKTWFHRPR